MQYAPFFLISFALTLLFTPLVRIIAVKWGLVSHPRADRWHKKPTAILGGVGIYLSSFIAALFVTNISSGFTNKNVLGLFLGATFLFIVGLIDDKRRLPPYVKLFAQIIAGGIAVFSGIILKLPIDNIFAIPLTLLWVIGITNAFNLLDNIDGLTAGIAAICSLMLFVSSLVFFNNPLCVFALILSGAALGFLPYNFPPARIFMGDSGSMFLGYSLAVISISGTSRHLSNFLITMIIPVLILSVPIFDTLFVMIGRKLQGRGIFIGGKDHTSHRLVTLGLSPRKTVLLLYLLSFAFGLIAVSYFNLNFFMISVIAFLSFVVLLFFGLFLFEVSFSDNQQKDKHRLNSGESTVINNIFMHKRRAVEVLLDLIFICIAYYSAYFLRFEGSLLSSNLSLISYSLVWIIIIKMSVFFIFGLYRGVWKYIGISDFLTIFKVVSIGSIVSILFLTFTVRFKDYSRAVFFIDWLILLFLVAGSRFMFRIIGEFFSRIQNGGRRVLVFGAGDTGEMVIREIKRNKALHYNPIGFIDDDPRKTGTKIHSIPVLGGSGKIRKLIQKYNIEEVLIAVPSVNAGNLVEIISICNDCGISYRKIKGILDRDDEFNVAKE